MGEIKLSFIFIKKNDKQNIKEMVLKAIDSVVDTRDSDKMGITLHNKVINVKYRIMQKKNSPRCYLELSAEARVNDAIGALELIDSAINKKSEDKKYYYTIKDYDGVSEYYCEKLYDKLAHFERLIRQLIYIVVTKAYGMEWFDKTISGDVKTRVKEVAKGSSKLVENALENMEFQVLEDYLFSKTTPNIEMLLENELSPPKLEKMEKEQICTIINSMRPRSLWERNFVTIGEVNDWSGRIESIHNIRNKVAHHKEISKKDYESNRRNLLNINRDLLKEIDRLKSENFTEEQSVDVLGSLAVTLRRFMDVFNSDEMKTAVNSISNALSTFAEACTAVDTSYRYSSLIAKGYIDQINAVGKSIASSMEAETAKMNETFRNFKI